MMKKVSITKCADYELDHVRQSVRAALEPLGGIGAFVCPGDRVLLKPNLLMRRRPEKATTTHPAVVQAVSELVVEAGGKPVIFDSPGGYYYHSRATLDALYDTCGMKRAAEAGGAELCYDEAAVNAPCPGGRMLKGIETIQSVLDADKIINIPKLKTHMMMAFSGAVKNMFGIVPGRHKTEYHFRFKDENDFASALVDICLFARPVLSVMDAITGMEGQGPTNGRPRHIGLILAGAEPWAVDLAAVQVVGLDAKKVPILRECANRKLCGMAPDEGDICGERLQDVAIKGFQKPPNMVAANIYDWMLPRPVAKWLNRAMKFKPSFRTADCKGCGVCARSCPVQAIMMKKHKPVFDSSLCISCFCCHELCNYDAININKPWMMRVLFK